MVTGGARRIGREIAFTLAQAGTDVAITYLKSVEEARETTAQIASFGVRSFALKCDLRDEAQIRSTAKLAVGQMGRLDLLINNSGFYQTSAFEKLSATDWDEAFGVNVRGPFLMTQACAEQLREQKGRIINIGSLGGIRPWATHAHYCASKAALHMLTQVSAKALAPDITVNCVAPGMIDQGEAEHEEIRRRFAEKTPMQRNGNVNDVAQAALFFATCPDFITGQILTVDGGLALS